jgi:Uma2 family endonuclease
MSTETLLVEQPSLALPPEVCPDVEHLVTEDDTPVDNIFSEKQQRLLTEPLYHWPDWAGERRSFIALANVGLFYAVGQPPYVPDMMLSLDVELPADLWPKKHRSYFVWQYGKPPDVVIEVVSNDEGDEDDAKLAGYARIGIRYYVIYDPQRILSDQAIRAFGLQPTGYQPLPEPTRLAGIGLGLEQWEGQYEDHHDTWLRWTDERGRLIPTGAECIEHQRQRAEAEKRRAEAEKRRAETEKQRAETEKQRAETEKQRAEAQEQRAEAQEQRAEAQEQRAERLAEQLRRLGVQPEG